MGESDNRPSSAFFIERTELICEKEFSHLLEPDSAAKYGDPYPKYIDNAMVRLDGMAAYSGCLLEGHAAVMTVARIFSRWRNRLQAVKDCKENMRVFSRSEREIVTLFRKFCRDCVEMADRPPDEGRETKPAWREYARRTKDGALSVLGELFTVPELYEINERFAIAAGEGEEGKDAGGIAGRPEKTFKITIELTEKEARAYETAARAEQKIRAALTEAGRETG